jgi:hypothetical protein
VAWFNNEFHICFQDHGCNGLMHITNLTGEGRGWNRPASWYHGVNTSAGPAAVAAGGKVHLFYRVPNGNGIFHQDSRQRRRLGASRLHRPGLRWTAAGDPPPTQTLSYLEVEQDAYDGQTSNGRVAACDHPTSWSGAASRPSVRPRCPAITGVAVVHDVVLNDVVLNQVLLRFGNDDATTIAVVAPVQRSGECWMCATTWHGIRLMRGSVSNWSTTEQDVGRAVVAVTAAWRDSR